MKTKKISYEEARPRMKAGDVVAFGGKGHISEDSTVAWAIIPAQPNDWLVFFIDTHL